MRSAWRKAAMHLATLQVLAAQLARREPLTEDELALAVQIDTTQPVDVSTLPALTA